MNNINPEFIKTAKENDAKKLMDSLSEKDREKVNNILSDKDALAQILNSPKAQAIMKMLSKKDNNG